MSQLEVNIQPIEFEYIYSATQIASPNSKAHFAIHI